MSDQQNPTDTHTRTCSPPRVRMQMRVHVFVQPGNICRRFLSLAARKSCHQIARRHQVCREGHETREWKGCSLPHAPDHIPRSQRLSDTCTFASAKRVK